MSWWEGSDVLPDTIPARAAGQLEVRLVDGCGWSRLYLVELDRLEPGAEVTLDYELPPRETDRLFFRQPPHASATFVLSEERDRDGRPVLRLKDRGVPPIRYPD